MALNTARPSYHYLIVDDVLVIFDHGEGMSVTNAAEAVIEELAAVIGGRRVIYRDTDGHFDELVVRDGRFNGFRLLNTNVLSIALARVHGHRR